jgi:quercetin dioxygenase-like cupin family protein
MIIYHRDRPSMRPPDDFPGEPWRAPICFAVNRSVGSTSMSIWTHDFHGERRAPLHWHDCEEVLVFMEVEGEGFVRVGDQEFRVESNTSVVVPPGALHCFGIHGDGAMKSLSVLPDADAVLGHRLYPDSPEPAELPPPGVDPRTAR